MTHKVYLAAPWKHRAEARIAADELRARGHEVNCRWLEHPQVSETDEGAPEFLREQALNDLDDLSAADVLVYMNNCLSEGKATELGFALASSKPIVLVGPRQNNVFLQLDIPQFDTVSDAADYLETALLYASY